MKKKAPLIIGIIFTSVAILICAIAFPFRMYLDYETQEIAYARILYEQGELVGGDDTIDNVRNVATILLVIEMFYFMFELVALGLALAAIVLLAITFFSNPKSKRKILSGIFAIAAILSMAFVIYELTTL